MTETPASAAPAPSTPFTAAGAWRGFVVTQPLAIGGLVYGMTFGILALGNGLSLAQAMVMSLTVYSGSGQIAAVGAMHAGAGLFATVATVLLLNARYVLYGAALRPWLVCIAPLKAYSLLSENVWLTRGLFAAACNLQCALRPLRPHRKIQPRLAFPTGSVLKEIRVADTQSAKIRKPHLLAESVFVVRIAVGARRRGIHRLAASGHGRKLILTGQVEDDGFDGGELQAFADMH
jgi:hypothetical protein